MLRRSIKIGGRPQSRTSDRRTQPDRPLLPRRRWSEVPWGYSRRMALTSDDRRQFQPSSGKHPVLGISELFRRRWSASSSLWTVGPY